MRVIFLTFCHYLLNGISFFAFMGHFWKMPLKNKIPLSPDCIAVWSEEECDDSSSFFPTNQHQTLFCFFGRALYRLGKWEVTKLTNSGEPPAKSGSLHATRRGALPPGGSLRDPSSSSPRTPLKKGTTLLRSVVKKCNQTYYYQFFMSQCLPAIKQIWKKVAWSKMEKVSKKVAFFIQSGNFFVKKGIK